MYIQSPALRVYFIFRQQTMPSLVHVMALPPPPGTHTRRHMHMHTTHTHTQAHTRRPQAHAHAHAMVKVYRGKKTADSETTSNHLHQGKHVLLSTHHAALTSSGPSLHRENKLNSGPPPRGQTKPPPPPPPPPQSPPTLILTHRGHLWSPRGQPPTHSSEY